MLSTRHDNQIVSESSKLTTIVGTWVYNFDPANFVDTYQVPEFNVSSLIDAQCKDIETLSAVTKAVVEGF